MKSKYYILKNEIDEKKVGKDFSQIGFMQPRGRVLSSWEYPDPSLKFNLELSEKSILTDFLRTDTVSAIGFFVSQKVKDILEGFELMKHSFYPAMLKTSDGSVEQYYWFHLCDPIVVDQIDYNKSVFHRTKFNAKKEEIQVDSFKHYEALKEEKGFSFGARIEKIAFLDSVQNYDLFTILPFDTQVYISAELHDALAAAEVSGFRVAEEQKLVLDH